MRLEEATTILGLSLDDITIDIVKETYEKLTANSDFEKTKDPFGKSKYLEISEAYNKLIAIMEGSDSQRGDDSHEIAAFMRMFMDMVGISDNETAPAAMTFGMMFGARQNTAEEWSTDEDGDGDYDEDDEDEEEEDDYLSDEYYDECEHHQDSQNCPQLEGGDEHSMGVWEPQAKQYSNMDLKEQASKERRYEIEELFDDDEEEEDEDDLEDGDAHLSEADREKKLRLAKKKAEKRKKQKVKKSVSKSEEANNLKVSKEIMSKSIEAELNAPEAKRLISLHKDHIKSDLVNAVCHGQLGKVTQILGYDFSHALPPLISMRIAILIKMELPNYLLLHKCISDLSLLYDDIVRTSTTDTSSAPAGSHTAAGSNFSNANNKRYCSTSNRSSEVMALASKRLEVARYLLKFQNPSLNLGILDLDGLTVLHLAILYSDLNFTKLVLNTLASDPNHKGELNLNSKCQKRGWSPLHYAVDRCDINTIRMLIQNGASISTMSTIIQPTGGSSKNHSSGHSSKITPLDLAKSKLKVASAAVGGGAKGKGSSSIRNIYEYIIEELMEASTGNHAKGVKAAGSLSSTAALDVSGKAKSAAADSAVNPFAAPRPSASQRSTSLGSAKGLSERELNAIASPLVDRSRKTVDISPGEAPSLGQQATKHPEPEQSKDVPVPEIVAPVEIPLNAAERKKLKKAAKRAAAATEQSSGSSPTVATPPTTNVLAVPTAGTESVGSTTKIESSKQPASSNNAKTTGKGKSSGHQNIASSAGNHSAKPVASTAASDLSVVSRDEMVDRLLAMGFREADCLTAITLYGTDIDQAISWLCERPVSASASGVTVATTTTATVTVTPGVVKVSKKEPPAPKGKGKASNQVDSAAAAKNSAALASAAAAQQAESKLQKDKEELRRINKAWNENKADEEKRRAEQQRKAAEEDKQRELVVHKHAQIAAAEKQQQLQQQLSFMQQQQSAPVSAWGTTPTSLSTSTFGDLLSAAAFPTVSASNSSKAPATPFKSPPQQSQVNPPSVSEFTLSPGPTKSMPSLYAVPASPAQQSLPSAQSQPENVLPLNYIPQTSILAPVQQQQAPQQQRPTSGNFGLDGGLNSLYPQQPAYPAQQQQQQLQQQHLHLHQHPQQQHAPHGNFVQMMPPPQPSVQMHNGQNYGGPQQQGNMMPFRQQPVPMQMQQQQPQQMRMPQQQQQWSQDLYQRGPIGPGNMGPGFGPLPVQHQQQAMQMQQHGFPSSSAGTMGMNYGLGQQPVHLQPRHQMPLGPMSFEAGNSEQLLFDDEETLVDGALELSAGARPFVPRSSKLSSYGSAPSQGQPLQQQPQHMMMPQSAGLGFDSLSRSGPALMQQPHDMMPLHLQQQQYGAPGMRTGGQLPLENSQTSWLRNLSPPSNANQLQQQSAAPSHQSFGFLTSSNPVALGGGAGLRAEKESDFLSSLLPAGLNLDDDTFDFGANSPSAGPDSTSSDMRNAFDALLRFDNIGSDALDK